MKKKILKEKTAELINETKTALQLVYNSLNKGQQNKIIKNEEVKKLFDRYNVNY